MKRQDLRQSPQYGQYMRSTGWIVTQGCFVKKMPLLPVSVVKIQRPDRLPNLKSLKKFRPVFISYEPLPATKPPSDFRLATPLLPSKTIWLDLTKPEEALLKNMHHKTRYNILKHRLSPYRIQFLHGDKISGKQLADFFQIYQQNSRRQKFWGLNYKQLNSLITSFGKKAHLLLANQGGGLLILVHDKVAYYSHNASTSKGKKQFIPTLLTWEGIKLAKKLNCVRFDFEGITDERWPLTQKWVGFTRFKKGFGGKVVEYPGNFVSWRWPL